jgi:hypothetical protein
MNKREQDCRQNNIKSDNTNRTNGTNKEMGVHYMIVASERKEALQKSSLVSYLNDRSIWGACHILGGKTVLVL